MQVLAKETLYYGHRRWRAGQQFQLKDAKDFSSKSMESLEPKTDEPQPEKKLHWKQRAKAQAKEA